jgi:hypothetical protein
MTAAEKFRPGQVVFTRPSGYDEESMVVRIEDGASGAGVVEARIPLADFARALTGLWSPCTFRPSSPLVGKKRETKYVMVEVDPHKASSVELRRLWAQEALKAHEVDGWAGRVDDMLNHNRHVSDKVLGDGTSVAVYKVVFVRYVDAD